MNCSFSFKPSCVSLVCWWIIGCAHIFCFSYSNFSWCQSTCGWYCSEIPLLYLLCRSIYLFSLHRGSSKKILFASILSYRTLSNTLTQSIFIRSCMYIAEYWIFHVKYWTMFFKFCLTNHEWFSIKKSFTLTDRGKYSINTSVSIFIFDSSIFIYVVFPDLFCIA